MADTRTHLATALADRYRIQRELGQGGMATVYLAEDLKHDRKVAIKVLRPELSAVIGAERFLREIKTIATLQHPHILGLIDCGEVNGTAYYVMPFVEGESLRDRLTREKQLPIADAIRIATEVAAALDYAHRHGVIHRDIKPENVMLHDGSALVADFGIALAVSSAGGGSRMTETGMSLGTPHYMSPEQAMGEREITARSDVYALGAMTYEMLVGDPPFIGSTAQAIVAQVLTEDPRPLVVRRRSVPPEVEAAVLTALEKLPADRFGSAQEFAAALSGTVASRPTRSRPRPLPPASHRGGDGCRRQRGQSCSRSQRTPSVPAGLSPPVFPSASVRPSRSPGIPASRCCRRSHPTGRPSPMPAAARFGCECSRGPSRVGAASRSPTTPRRFNRIRVGLPTEAESCSSSGAGSSRPGVGGVEKPEVPPGRNGRVISAAWSPDGTRIAYVIGDSLFIRDARSESRGIARVFEANGCVWSPDGADIACSSGNAISLTVGPVRQCVTQQDRHRARQRRAGRADHRQPLAQSEPGLVAGRALALLRLQPLRPKRHLRPEDVRRVTPGPGAQADDRTQRPHHLALGRRRWLAYASIDIESNAWSMPIPAHPPGSVTRATQLTHGSQFVEAVEAVSVTAAGCTTIPTWSGNMGPLPHGAARRRARAADHRSSR